MADSTDRKSKTKHRKSTCAGCRRRKSKCDGKTPKCTTCIAYKDECIYDKPPSLAYVRSLEDENELLRNQLKSFKTQAWVNKSTHPEEKKILPATSPAVSAASSSKNSEYSRNGALPYRSSRPTKWEADISVDDRGSVSFHGLTSAVHEPPNLNTIVQVPSQQIMSPKSQQDEEQVKQDLRQNAQQQRQMEDFGIAKTAPRVNIPKEVSEELLRFHWCWIHPLFLFVYRPAFTRGMTLVNASQPGSPDPPYYSETLLKVMTSHTARFLNHDVYQQHFNARYTSSEFMQQITQDARVSLAMETLNSSSIPTIQAFLQQSAREIVFGRSSQAWLYGGMAFRMAFDMGIHLPTDKLETFVKSLSNEDIEVRKRLFWSCYTWDKVLSLYLGRMPAFTPLADEMPLSFFDDFTDTAPWQPYYGESPDATTQSLPSYPSTPGYVVSCFQQLCKLCIIINDLMQSIYSAEAATRRSDEARSAEAKASEEVPFVRISRSLHEWWISLPPHLKVDTSQDTLAQKLAPPIHIMSLNLLYHTTVILLHRPIVLAAQNPQGENIARSYQTCLYATAAIHDLLFLQANTFGLSQISYLNAYCAYTAAIISVLRFERELQPMEDHNVISKKIGLDYLLDVIEQSAARMPGLERSHEIITKWMRRVVNAHLQAKSVLSPIDLAGQAATIGPTTDEMALVQATAFPQMPHPGVGNVFDPTQMPHHMPDASQATSMPNQNSVVFTTTMSSDLAGQMPLPAFVDDFLPAFPGQQFPVGPEYYFGGNDFDSHARMSLMGFNLDPHPRLDPSAIHWNLIDNSQMSQNAPMTMPTPMSQNTPNP